MNEDRRLIDPQWVILKVRMPTGRHTIFQQLTCGCMGKVVLNLAGRGIRVSTKAMECGSVSEGRGCFVIAIVPPTSDDPGYPTMSITAEKSNILKTVVIEVEVDADGVETRREVEKDYMESGRLFVVPRSFSNLKFRSPTVEMCRVVDGAVFKPINSRAPSYEHRDVYVMSGVSDMHMTLSLCYYFLSLYRVLIVPDSTFQIMEARLELEQA